MCPITAQIKEYLKLHCKKFNYSISLAQEEEIILLYKMNNLSFNKNSLVLHIERFMKDLKFREGNFYLRDISENEDIKNIRNNNFNNLNIEFKNVEDKNFTNINLKNNKESTKEWRLKRRPSVCARRIEMTELDAPIIAKNEITKTFLFNALGSGFTRDILSPAQRRVIIEYTNPKTVEKGTIFIKEGDIGNEMYIVESGEFDVFVAGKKVSNLSRGSSFGEIALLHSVPRTATIIAVKDSLVWEVTQNIFSAVRIRDKQRNRALIRDALKVSCLFKDDYILNAASSTANYRTINSGEWIGIDKDREVAILLSNGFLKSDGDVRGFIGDVLYHDFTAISNLEIALVSLEYIKK